MSLFDRQILEQSWSVIYHWEAFNFAILNLVKSEKWICPTLSGFRQSRSHIVFVPKSRIESSKAFLMMQISGKFVLSDPVLDVY